MLTVATEDGWTVEMSVVRRSGDRHRRAATATVLAVVVCGVAAAAPGTPAAPRPQRANVLLVITDDQPWSSLPTTAGPAAMPWLEARVSDPGDHWVRFTNAFLNVPLCCPSRASILTGRYARLTGVQSNDDGENLDESSTLATWLDDAGYQTAFIGKYLNGYPWDRGPYVPAGWDRFLAKRNLDVSTTYVGYPYVDQGVPMTAGTTQSSYATSMLAAEATAFLRAASAERPWFLVFAPSAPHEPWTPAPQDAGTLGDAVVDMPGPRAMNDVRGKPGWIRALPEIDEGAASELEEHRRRMLESLTGVDRALRSLVGEIEARNELGRTIIVFLSDNGYSFGEHRWVGKRCPYDACVRTPLVVRSPWVDAGVVSTPVSNVDLAPTIMDLVDVTAPTAGVNGRSLRPVLDDRAADDGDRRAVLIEWAGDDVVPAWRGVRTEAFSYLEHADGTIELYDLGGRLGHADPWELRNRASDPRYAAVRRALAASLDDLIAQEPVPAVP
jgi:arylsulfatase A-like enzyme